MISHANDVNILYLEYFAGHIAGIYFYWHTGRDRPPSR